MTPSRLRLFLAPLAVALFAVLALARPELAHAGTWTNTTDEWCEARPRAIDGLPATDVVLVSDLDLELLWRTTGVLTLRSRSGVNGWTTVWDSRAGETLCFSKQGQYQIKNAQDAVIWTLGTALASPDVSTQDVVDRLSPSFAACNLTMKLERTTIAAGQSTFTTTVLWTKPATCTTAGGTWDNQTVGWCRPRPTNDETILASAQSVLVWRSTGVLSLQPVAAPIDRAAIWKSEAGETLCFTTLGQYQVKDANGRVVWSLGTGLGDLSSSGNTVRDRLYPVLSECKLTMRHWQQVERPRDPDDFYMTLNSGIVESTTNLWARSATCPVFARSNVLDADGWCFDNTEQRILTRTPYAELIWRTHGGLNLVGTGIRAGVQIWGSGTYGVGRKICFQNDGRLVIYGDDDAMVWSSNDAGSTLTDYMIGLDGCSLSLQSLNSPTRRWDVPLRCPQEYLGFRTYTRGATEQVMIENDQARLSFDSGGYLRLRSRSGHEFWNSRTPGEQAVFDGTLYVVNAAGARVMDLQQQGETLELAGCALQLKRGAEVVWSRGAQTCDPARFDFGDTTRPLEGRVNGLHSGLTRLAQSDEAYLQWQPDGNLVLATHGNFILWSTGTNHGSARRTLIPDASGDLAITDGNGATLWRSNTSGGSARLVLGDNCALRLITATTSKPLHTSCKVELYAFEQSSGGDLFGTNLSNDVSIDQVNGVARVDAVTRLYLKIFGFNYQLFSAAAYQTEDTEVASLSIGASAGLALNASYEREFFKREQTFWLGFVPVKVEAAATGAVALAAEYPGGAIKITPSAGLYATVKAGVGIGGDGLGASAGIQGALTLIELGFPISLRVYTENGARKFSVAGSIAVDFLSGALGLYAEAHLLFVSIEWTIDLFSWAGISIERPLFSKSASF